MSEIEPVNEKTGKVVEGEENEPEWAGDPKKMGFLDHLEELRWTLIKPIAAFLLTFILVMIFIKDFSDFLLMPLLQSFTPEEKQAFDGLATRNLMGVYTAMMHMGLIAGIATSSPFFVYNIGKFISPALTKRERVILVPGSIAAMFLFILGCAFSFFALVPKAIDVTIWFNAMMGFQIIWSPDSYFSFITWMVIGMGLSFQFPLVVVVLVYSGLVSVQALRNKRRVVILCIFVAGALLTPPDPITQVMMAMPMYLLYELSIVIAAFLVRKHKSEAPAEYDEEEYED